MSSAFFRSALVLVIFVANQSLPAQEAPVTFRLTHAGPKAFTGRVFVIVSKRDVGAGVFGQSWFTPEPFFAQVVKDWPAGEERAFEPTFAFPGPMKDLKAGTYFVQTVLDRDLGGQNPLTSSGNQFSKGTKIELDPAKPATIGLHADQTVPEKTLTDTKRVRLFEIDSPLLTKFHGRPMKLRAGVILPKSYGDKPEKTYPVVYEIPGFGGDHRAALQAAGRVAGEMEMIVAVLDPSCRTGHHVFADSANNGPVGKALVEEFIPALEKKFHGSGKRFVTGHSSGGWSSLWLQITYPDTFHGVWSTAPDSVDFRDFQLVNLYEKNANLFYDPKGDLRPIARRDGKTVLTTKRFSDMETVFGRGGQLYSFEAVFSPRGPDGEPARVWDRKTGAVDPAVAAAWEAYDIRLILEKNWPTLAPKLKGKIHVIMGAEDTFFLDGATRLLKASLEKLGSDAVVEIVPGRHHGNLVDATVRQRIGHEMAERAK